MDNKPCKDRKRVANKVGIERRGSRVKEGVEYRRSKLSKEGGSAAKEGVE